MVKSKPYNKNTIYICNIGTPGLSDIYTPSLQATGQWKCEICSTIVSFDLRYESDTYNVVGL